MLIHCKRPTCVKKTHTTVPFSFTAKTLRSALPSVRGAQEKRPTTDPRRSSLSQSQRRTRAPRSVPLPRRAASAVRSTETNTHASHPGRPLGRTAAVARNKCASAVYPLRFFGQKRNSSSGLSLQIWEPSEAKRDERYVFKPFRCSSFEFVMVISFSRRSCWGLGFRSSRSMGGPEALARVVACVCLATHIDSC